VGNVPKTSTWQIRCEDCNPDGGGDYWFSLNRCDTPAKALDSILNEDCPPPIVMESFIDLIVSLFVRGALVNE
jgi:hypothetical protein